MPPAVLTSNAIRESEADFTSWFVDFLRVRHWTIRHISDSRKEVVDKRGRRSIVGDTDCADLPDWLVVRERVAFVELKGWQRRGKYWRQGELSLGQAAFIEELRAAGTEAHAFWPEDRAEIERLFA